jgi:RNA recognition motif-containing protein
LDRFSVFVGNLNEDISQNDLYEEFGGCGIIVNVHIIRKPYYRHRTKKVFAFIKYENERGATEAIDQKVYADHSSILL